MATILALYLGLALVYNAATPIFEASDEFRHFLTVRWISLHHQLPVIAPERDPFTPGQEAGQPPLYYLAGSLMSSWVDTSDITQTDFNPHGDAGIPTTSPDSKNLFVHSAAEDFPYHGVSLAAHLVRLLSIALGAATVYLTYRLALAVAPSLPAVSTMAAALVAFNPQFLFVSASVDNDGLITTVSTAALLVMAGMVITDSSSQAPRNDRPANVILSPRAKNPSPLSVWLLSALLGIAILSKFSGLALVPLAAAVVAWANRHAGWRHVLKAWAILAVGPIVIAGWWAARNMLTYGEPTGLSAWVAQYQGSRAPGVIELLGEAPGLFASYWAVFGAFDIKGDAWLYVFYLVITLAGLGGLFLARHRIQTWQGVALLGAWFAIELAALIRWTTLTTASTGRLLFPAIAAVATIVAIGLMLPLPLKARWPATYGVSGVLLALAVYAPVRYIFPAYARPAIVRSAGALGQPSTAANLTYAGKLQIIGYDLAPVPVKPGDAARVRLYWHVLAPMERNYSATVQLLSGEGTVGQYDSFPGQGRIATRHLQPGDYFSDMYQVKVSPTAPTPLIAQVKVGLYDFYANLAKLPATDATGAELPEPIIGELPVVPAAPPASAPPALASFGGQIDLLAGGVASPTVPAGGSLAVDLTWRAAGRPRQPYTVFTHLADDAGRPVAQYDAQPREGAFPTTWWAPGEIIQDRITLTVPPNTPPGAYQLLVGLYEQPSLQRLPASTGGDSLRLATVTVTAG